MTFQHFMKNWEKQDQCFEEEKIELTYKSGKKEFKPWQHDRLTVQIVYEDEWLKVSQSRD
jgi:hypothetical protein